MNNHINSYYHYPLPPNTVHYPLTLQRSPLPPYPPKQATIILPSNIVHHPLTPPPHHIPPLITHLLLPLDGQLENRLTAHFIGHTSPIRYLAVSEGDLITTSSDNKVKCWRLVLTSPHLSLHLLSPLLSSHLTSPPFSSPLLTSPLSSPHISSPLSSPHITSPLLTPLLPSPHLASPQTQ